MRHYRRECEMYRPVASWLQNLLQARFRRASVSVVVTAQTSLRRFLERKSLTKFFPLFATFEIHVDVLGLISHGPTVDLAFVECKLKPISLKDVSQILGYSKVANPVLSLIISPRGLSSAIHQLIGAFGRYDVLEYSHGRRVFTASWNSLRGEVDLSTLLPFGNLI